MGTDIYAYIEVQDGDIWKLTGGDLNFQRSYTLFGLMAGVQGDGCMFPPRSTPSDLSQALKDDRYMPCHSASWLTQQEFRAVAEQYDPEMEGWLPEILNMMQDPKGRPTRLVFWFD